MLIQDPSGTGVVVTHVNTGDDVYVRTYVVYNKFLAISQDGHHLQAGNCHKNKSEIKLKR